MELGLDWYDLCIDPAASHIFRAELTTQLLILMLLLKLSNY